MKSFDAKDAHAEGGTVTQEANAPAATAVPSTGNSVTPLPPKSDKASQPREVEIPAGVNLGRRDSVAELEAEIEKMKRENKRLKLQRELKRLKEENERLVKKHKLQEEMEKLKRENAMLRESS